ncbi:MAG: SBBP repeat-containing protein [Chloroflexia bacterium]
MKGKSTSSLSMILILAFALLPLPSQALSQPPSEATSQAQSASLSALTSNFGNMPLSFEPNAGQADPSVHFTAHAAGGSALYFSPSEVVLVLPMGKPHAQSAELSKAAPDPMRSVEIPMRFVGANPGVNISGDGTLPGKTNYLVGDDPLKWRTNVPTYSGISYASLYPGVDMAYSGDGPYLKGTYTVAAGADPSRIAWLYDGAKVSVDEAGNLQVAVADENGEAVAITEHAPVAWQLISGNKVNVPVSYSIAADGTAGFRVGVYNQAYQLVIDPAITWSTYFGGTGSEREFWGIAIDGAGNIYLTGSTRSTDFPTKNPIQNAHHGGNYDTAIFKLTAGGALIYSTYLGGDGDDAGLGIAVDADGNAYVTGLTCSTNFPTASALQPQFKGACDAFVSKLDASGSKLSFSTYLGGEGRDNGNAIALDSSGDVLIVGGTGSTTFPTANPIQSASGGGIDGFVSRLSKSGSNLIYSTYLGGSDSDSCASIAIDKRGNSYIVGITASTNFPTKNPKQAAYAGNNDAFLLELNPQGSALVYSTYLGGSDIDAAIDVALDSTGDVYLGGTTYSTNFPTLNAYKPSCGACGIDGFLARFDSDGTDLLMSSYFGGSARESLRAIAVDKQDMVYMVGSTESQDLPVMQPTQNKLVGTNDAFVTQLDPANKSLLFSTYLGGDDGVVGVELATDVAIDPNNDVLVAGTTPSRTFPTKDPLQAAYTGERGIFVTKFQGNPHLVSSTPTPVPTVSIPGSNTRTFPQTNKTVRGIFLDYWDKNGGLAQQGYPISDLFGEVSTLNGQPYTVQYFERAVFEYHPENQPPYNILLSQLGTFQYQKRYPAGAPGQQPNNSVGSRLVPQTGKRLGGRFLDYWEKHGGLAQQGYPISDEFLEVSQLNGKQYLVQYFERAVFEYHPENQPPYDVLLSLLGTFEYQVRYQGGGQSQPPPQAQPTATPQPTTVAGSCDNIPTSQNMTITPTNCARAGNQFTFQGRGFDPGEMVGVYATRPNGSVDGAPFQVQADSQGVTSGQNSVILSIATNAQVGIWAVTMEGVTSQKKAIGYVRVLTP